MDLSVRLTCTIRERLLTRSRSYLFDPISNIRSPRSVSRKETADLFELYKRLECFAVELALPQMSDRDVRRLESILGDAVVAAQRGDMQTYAVRDREFHETIAGQSGNFALIETLARFALQIPLCSTIAKLSQECAERAAHGCDDIVQALKARDTLHAAFLVRAHISHVQETVLSQFSK